VYVPVNKQAIADIIRAAAARYGDDPNQLLRVAMCESGLNPNAYNPYSGATGLFQFKPPTFAAHGGQNIWDATDQANIAAKMFSQGLAYEWGCK
jgi:soluble lytic murein transglycosylase-like protein